MAEGSEDPSTERARLARIVHQHLDSLLRAGLTHLPAPRVRTQASPPRIAPTLVEPALSPTSPARPSPPAEPTQAPPIASPSRPEPRAASPGLVGSLFEEPPLGGTVPAEQRPQQLATLAAEVAGCVRCPHLASTRTQTVFGEGNPNARLMFVGEAPGADEDRSGRPFVGRAGMLLTDMITKGMGLQREDVYIANVLKSRPPENRTPEPDEISHCLPYLERQIEIIRPEFLCLLGKTAASALLETSLPMSRLRGKWHRYRGIPVVVTYHPSYLLRNPPAKKDAWEDLQMLMQVMGLKVPERRRPPQT